jgi:hypothetical protein
MFSSEVTISPPNPMPTGVDAAKSVPVTSIDSFGCPDVGFKVTTSAALATKIVANSGEIIRKATMIFVQIFLLRIFILLKVSYQSGQNILCLTYI